MSNGYGKWIRDSAASPGSWCWSSMPPTKSPEASRELAAELLAWADAHDTVTITIPKKTAERAAGWVQDGHHGVIAHAARKALGMEP